MYQKSHPSNYTGSGSGQIFRYIYRHDNFDKSIMTHQLVSAPGGCEDFLDLIWHQKLQNKISKFKSCFRLLENSAFHT